MNNDDPVLVLRAWLRDGHEGRLMALVSKRPIFHWVGIVLDRLQEAESTRDACQAENERLKRDR